MPPTPYTLLRLDPQTGPRPIRYFPNRADASREARRLNRDARFWSLPWRWAFRRARPGETGGMDGF
jgi:hypothetical protein